MNSGGDEEKVSQAQKILKNAIIGLVIVLASWAIATFILSRLSGAMTSGGGSGCLDGESSSCGCGGAMVCSGGAWGACIGSDCSNISGPTGCDSSDNQGCQAANQICAPDDYCDAADCGCKPRGNLGDPCDTDLDNATCDADNNRCAQYLTCDAQSCTCYGPPVITGISPAGGFCSEDRNKSCAQDSDCVTTCNLDSPNGSANNLITIFGKNFAQYSATTSQVIFASDSSALIGRQPADLNPACINSWTDSQIIIAVPAGNASGPIKVVNKDNLADTTNDDYGPLLPNFENNNINRPGLCSLNPGRGALSEEVGYQGVNLLAGVGYFGSYQSNVRALQSEFNDPDGLAGTSTVPNIRSGDSSTFVQSNLNGHSQKSNYLLFTKDSEPGEGPFISSFSPSSGSAGQYVTIRGQGFGGARGTNHVYFNDTEAAYDFPEICLNSVWRDSQIIVKVPAGLTDGQQTIRISLGTTTIDTQKLNPPTFTADKNLALKTSLCKISPVNGPAATPVTLWGEYFGTGEGQVKFNYDKNATGTIEKDGRADMIKTVVPTGAITGPVRVIKNSEWGNELNFSIGACQADTDCGGAQVCCPANTYAKGRCVDTLAKCFIDIPTSVLEWSFSTGFSTSSIPTYNSCAGLANYFGACQTGRSCPNVPGACSPYAGGQKISGNCDYSCASVPGCGDLGVNNCSYNLSLDKCVKNGLGANCDLDKKVTYSLNNKEYQAAAVCNANKHWEINLSTSCPVINGVAWTKAAGNKCVDLSSNCSLCSADFRCELVGGSGRCVSAEICAGNGVCTDDPVGSNPQGTSDKCIINTPATCDCCCTIGQDARDCCAPLTCEGTCGSDINSADGTGFGRCGGCKSAGNTTEARDAACNCSGHSGQYCEINDPDFPDGVCTDCASLTNLNCTNHSSACCLDSKKTPEIIDDICRGGNGLSVVDSPGYCAYYNCQTAPGDPTKCASTAPVSIGNYATIESCDSNCLNSNPCPNFKTAGECLQDNRCCFDSRKTATTTDDVCRLGAPINQNGNPDNGYCAYYSCDTANPAQCASTTPVRGDIVGAISYNSTSSCIHYCQQPPAGPGLSCAGAATSTCATDKCNYPGFDCFAPDGQLGVESTGCGTCCCQPVGVGGNTIDSCATINSKLTCLADKGNCSGASRGLCCGCSNDDECGSVTTIGCSADTCCQARPKIATTSPAHLETNVCRNAAVSISFDQLMDISSFKNNILLLEERNYGNGVCPTGSFVAAGDSIADLLAQKNKSWLEKLYAKISTELIRLVGRFNSSALADIPSPTKLYCSISGTVSGKNNGDIINGGTTNLTFTPKKILAGNTNYYVIALGDTDLNSKSGLLSLTDIGFNGAGYFDQAANGGAGAYVAGDLIKFNNKSYKNSQIFKFTTLPEQGPNAGICTIDHVTIAPSSYLFRTTDNNLDENDNDADPQHNTTFDTKADRDKVFEALAYSANGQVLHPVTGYFWDWSFGGHDSQIVSINPVSGLPTNKVLVTAQNGQTDSETKITAAINMDRFSGASCTVGNCSCQGNNCSNNCCNVYSGGDGFNSSANVYVFLCNNPWPPVAANGVWSPWNDTCQDSIGGACADYNYKFYYCRDAGTADTFDDLPAILNQAVIRGQSANLICSADKTPCSGEGSICGPDKNGDGQADGLCIWNVLKESYFFREAILSAGTEITAADQQTGGTVRISWASKADQVGSYKIYYLKSGQGAMLSRTVKPSDVIAGERVCNLNGTEYACSAIISDLDNNIPYVFKISVISLNNTESQLSVEATATPTDKISPAVPRGLKATIVASSTVKFSWRANTDDTVFYRLYHGVMSGLYGESFDSAKATTSITLPLSSFPSTSNYFALSAIDANNNESAKSGEMIGYTAAACSPECAGRCSGESDDCGGVCAGNSGCAYSTEVKSCNSFFGTVTGFIGNVSCQDNCSGYDTSACVVNPSSSDWYVAPSAAETPVGRTCMVRLNVNNGAVVCNNNALGLTTAWFKGKIAFAGESVFCSVSGCVAPVNTNKCRYFSGDWSNQCYVSKLLP